LTGVGAAIIFAGWGVDLTIAEQVFRGEGFFFVRLKIGCCVDAQ